MLRKEILEDAHEVQVVKATDSDGSVSHLVVSRQPLDVITGRGSILTITCRSLKHARILATELRSCPSMEVES